MIRKAKISDVRSMHGILSEYAARGLLLGRSLSDLYAQLRDFIVVDEDSTHEIVGTCSLRICWEDIAEIRSLAVREDFREVIWAGQWLKSASEKPATWA